MLLEFKIKNYKSFLEECLFNMTKAPKQSGLDFSLLHEKIENKEYIGLCSSVIYGPNAAGKSNIIGAIDVLKSIIQKGTIDDDTQTTWSSANTAKYILNLIPNSIQKDNNPIEFYIKFTNDGMLFEYFLEIDVGKFMESDYKRKITREKFHVNELELFDRTLNSININTSNLKKLLKLNVINDLKESSVKAIAEKSIHDKELFLVAGFKTIYASEIVGTFLNWINNKLCIIYRADKSRVKYDLKNDDLRIKVLEKCVSEAIKKFGKNNSTIFLFSNDESKDNGIADNMTSVIESNTNNNNNPYVLPSEIYESYGTIRFANIFPFIEDSLKNGCTLVVDELDASIHPMAIINIITIFHNDDINKNKAQLIFNTHNPVYLDSNLFRRDEIKFVEKNSNYCSDLYSLSDFGTYGKGGVRKGEDYMKNYFINRYGAIENIDFSSILENEMEMERESAINEN